MPKAKSKLQVGSTLKLALSTFEENRSLIVRLTILFAALNAISSLLDVAGAAGFAISFGLTILLGAAYNGLVTAALCLPGKPGEAGELWAAVRPVLARLIWVTLISAVLVVAGLFALLIPGLVIVTLLSVAGQTVVVERAGVFDALGRSFTLVKDHAWRVFGYLLVIGLLSLVLLTLALMVAIPLGESVIGTMAASFLSNLLSTPVLAVGSAILYNQLAGLQREAKTDQPEPEPSSGDPV